ncbi:MAG: PASTA domain-containing protein [Bacteroidetes bacterium]|nr:PASTA domain-containing protein [Bacteroidota bacterium]
MDIKKDILWRVYLCFLGMIVLGAVVLGRAFYIQRVQGNYWKDLGENLHLKYSPVNAERGTIYSEDGNMLSTSVPVYDVIVDFGTDGLTENNGKRFKDNVDSLSTELAHLFKDKSPLDYKRELQQGYKEQLRYYVLKRKISFVEKQQMENFPLVRQGIYKSGFKMEAKDKRINPYILLANRTIGLSRQDSTKNVGLERSYDSLLKGASGQQLMRYVAGAYVPVDGAKLEAENGKDIITTLDTYMQDVAENALMKMMVGNNSLHGTVIVMETATGKIKAIANLGQLQYADGTAKKDKDGNSIYAEDLNYGIGKATEPGSIFKLATLMSLLDDKYVTIQSRVNCEGGSKDFYGLKIKDTHPNGDLSVKDAFAASSNVAFAKMADQYYHAQPSKFIAHLHHFRLDTLTGVDIDAASARTTIKKPTNRSWANTTIPFMAHGYEELVTPLHMLMLYNAVANNGKMMKPYLVNAVREYGVDIKTIQPKVLVEHICTDETLAQLKECLRAVVDSPHGTAFKVLSKNTYGIAGKTGTAVTALNNKGYNKNNKIYQASFIGYFPADQPKYTMAVVIQNSKESKLVYGADVSGTVFKEVSDKIYGRFLSGKPFVATASADSTVYNFYGAKYDVKALFNFLKMPYADSAAKTSISEVKMKNNFSVLNTPLYSSASPGSVTPDVVGMGLKDAVYLLENKGMKVKVTGRGRVVNQVPAAGTAFTKTNNEIAIVLN